MDIGPETEALYKERMKSARTVLWNGPMGDLEKGADFAHGTKELLEELCQVTKDHGVTSIVVGGSTAYYAHQQGMTQKLSYVTVNARSCLQYLSGTL